MQRLGAKILSIPNLFDDRFHGELGLANLILRRDTVMLEIGDEDGILYAEGVEPGGVAVVHIITFNGRARKDLDRILTESADWAFRTFGLKLLSAWIPAHNTLALRLMTRLRWHRDGIIRSWLRFDGQLEDCHVFSLSPEELEYGRQ